MNFAPAAAWLSLPPCHEEHVWFHHVMVKIPIVITERRALRAARRPGQRRARITLTGDSVRRCPLARVSAGNRAYVDLNPQCTADPWPELKLPAARRLSPPGPGRPGGMDSDLAPTDS
jgi:hypothetical protein